MRKYVIVRNTVTSNYTSPKKKTHTGDKGFGERHMVSCGSFVELNPLFCISKRAQTPFSKHITHTHANYFLPNERQHTSNEKTVFLLLKIFCIASTFLLHPTLHVTTISHTWMLFVRSGTSRLYQHIYIITYGCETIWHSFIIVSLLWLSYIHSSKEKKKKSDWAVMSSLDCLFPFTCICAFNTEHSISMAWLALMNFYVSVRLDSV